MSQRPSLVSRIREAGASSTSLTSAPTLAGEAGVPRIRPIVIHLTTRDKNEQQNAKDRHPHGQQLSHAEGSDDEPKLRVGLPSKLDQETEDAVIDKECTGQQAGPVPATRETPASKRPDDQSEQHSFREGL